MTRENETTCYMIDPQGGLSPVDYAEAVSGWKAGLGLYWIDAEAPDDESRAEVLAEFGLGADLIAELLEPGHASRVMPFDHGLMLEFPARMAGQPPEIKNIEVICLDRLVVTLRDEPFPTDFEATLRHRSVVSNSTSSGIVSTLLAEASVDLRRHASKLRERIIAYSRAMDDDPKALELGEILEVKREIIDLEAIGEEQMAVMEMLDIVKSPFLDTSPSNDRYWVARTNTASGNRRIERLERRAEDLRGKYDASQQDKTNRRLGRLTLISAIFLPLTLLAGIYGMNFQVMPELNHPLGYPIALGAMALIAVGMLWWFLFRGWMK